MAERRMFAKTIIDSDAFLDMPLSSQALYFHLSMRADDDGFINNPKKIQRVIGASEDDLKVLMAKNFLIPFETGIVVVKHWRIHNYIQNDRYKKTVYLEELEQLEIKKNKAYTRKNEMDTRCIHDASGMDTQVRLGKDSLGKDSLGKGKEGGSSDPLPEPKKPVKEKYGEYKHVKLTQDEFNRLCDDFGESLTLKAIKAVDEYVQEKGKTYKDYNLTIRRWGIDAAKKNSTEPATQSEKVDDIVAEWKKKFGRKEGD